MALGRLPLTRAIVLRERWQRRDWTHGLFVRLAGFAEVGLQVTALKAASGMNNVIAARVEPQLTKAMCHPCISLIWMARSWLYLAGQFEQLEFLEPRLL